MSDNRTRNQLQSVARRPQGQVARRPDSPRPGFLSGVSNFRLGAMDVLQATACLLESTITRRRNRFNSVGAVDDDAV
jgi:hypothetical protein